MKKPTRCHIWLMLTLVAGASLPANLRSEEIAPPEPEQPGIRDLVSGARELAREWATNLRDLRSEPAGPSTYMGVVIESVPRVLRDYIDLPRGVGILVSSVSGGSPAEKAGIQANDIIYKFDDQLIINFSQLSALIDIKGPGAIIPVEVVRKGEHLTLQVTLEQRLRRGSQWLPIAPDAPDAPEAPQAPDAVDPDEIGVWVERVDEWIPGSVRVFIDDNEQVHVDVDDLKDDLTAMKKKIIQIHQMDRSAPGIVVQHGDMGARTTLIRSREKQIDYVGPDGRATLTPLAEGERVSVWDQQGALLYEGALPSGRDPAVPEQARKLLQALQQARDSMRLDPDQDKIDVQLTVETGEPVTMSNRQAALPLLFTFDSTRLFSLKEGHSQHGIT